MFTLEIGPADRLIQKSEEAFLVVTSKIINDHIITAIKSNKSSASIDIPIEYNIEVRWLTQLMVCYGENGYKYHYKYDDTSKIFNVELSWPKI